MNLKEFLEEKCKGNRGEKLFKFKDKKKKSHKYKIKIKPGTKIEER